MNLQVLVATMQQEDLSILKKMNIRCSAVIANQADREEITNADTPYGKVKMITTASRGVGLNRNIALAAASEDILLLADDDVVYNDDMPEKVVAAFNMNPQADVIAFGMNILKDGKITEKRSDTNKKLHLWNSMRYGTYRIAIRRKALINNNITFNQCFGGGCEFSAGEDSLFLKSCFDCGLKVYANEYILGTCAKDTSTWFTGYDEKYFYDKGVLVRKLFPRSFYIMALYFGAIFKRETNLNVSERLKLVYAGVLGGKKMTTFKEYQK